MERICEVVSATPRVITVDKNAAYPKAFKELTAEEIMPATCELRQSKYLNNLIEQDHRFMKQLVRLGMGFFSFETACRTLHGYETMNMIRKTLYVKSFWSQFESKRKNQQKREEEK